MKSTRKKESLFMRVMSGRGYYIVLAVCALAVCAAAFLAVRGVRAEVADDPIAEHMDGVGNPDRSTDDGQSVSLSKDGERAEQPSGAGSAEQPESPAGTAGTPEKTDAEVLAQQDEAVATTITTEAPTLSKPLEGSLAVSYSNGELIRSITMNDFREHNGIDIAADEGTKVCAAASGTVDGLYYDDMWGQVVVLTHAGGLRTIYKNLDPDLPSSLTPGARVESGDVIGELGIQGLLESAEAPHLHLEIEKKGVLVNPLDYLSYE